MQTTVEQFVQAGRARLHVTAIGSGAPIIVVHGGPDLDHEYLRPDMDRLGDAFRLIYYDQRGRGRSFSGEKPGDITLTGEIDDLDRIRAHAETETVAVLGHSWGGLLAMEYAIRFPRRVSHLILMNTAPASHAGRLALQRERTRRQSLDDSERMASLRSDPEYQAGGLDADREHYRIHFASTVRDRVQLERLVARLRSGFTPEAVVAARAIQDELYRQTWDVEAFDLLPLLADLRIPSLVIHGDNDFVPVGVARDIAAAIPRSRLRVMADCGHFAYIDQPELVHTAIVDFMRTT